VEPGGGSFAGSFERQEEYMWVPFGPGSITILSLGVIWNYSKEIGLSWVDIRLWGTKDLSTRRRCIGTV